METRSGEGRGEGAAGAEDWRQRDGQTILTPRRRPSAGAREAGVVLQGPSIFSGTSHPALAGNICRYLEQSVGEAEIFAFSNENTFVRICENVRERDVFIVQTASRPVNSHVMELLIALDALRRASAGRITAVIPYYPYGRSDKKDQPRVPITARLIANLIETAGANRVLTVDLHAGQIQGFFNIPTDELTALTLFAKHFQEREFRGVVVAPDLGGAKRARNLAEKLGMPLALCEKRRAANDEHAEVLQLIGDVQQQDVLIIDDEVATGGTLAEVADLLRLHGARDIYVAATHTVLSGNAPERLAESPIKELVVTDTLPLPSDRPLDKVRTISVAPLLGEAIRRIHTGQSVGALFL